MERTACALQLEPFELDALATVLDQAMDLLPMTTGERWIVQRVLDLQVRNDACVPVRL